MSLKNNIVKSKRPKPTMASLGIGFIQDVGVLSKATMVVDIVKKKTGIQLTLRYNGEFPIADIRAQIPIAKYQKKFFEVRNATGQALRDVFQKPTDGFPSKKTKDGMIKYVCNLLDDDGKPLPLVRVILYTGASCYDSNTGKFITCYDPNVGRGRRGKGICPCGTNAPNQTSESEELAEYFPLEDKE